MVKSSFREIETYGSNRMNELLQQPPSPAHKHSISNAANKSDGENITEQCSDDDDVTSLPSAREALCRPILHLNAHQEESLIIRNAAQDLETSVYFDFD